MLPRKWPIIIYIYWPIYFAFKFAKKQDKSLLDTDREFILILIYIIHKQNSNNLSILILQ